MRRAAAQRRRRGTSRNASSRMISFVEADPSGRLRLSVCSMPRPTLFLIDGSSQMYRAYHAFRGRGLSNQEGHTTHAVYVFVTVFQNRMAEHKHVYMAESLDIALPTFRDKIGNFYKSN